MKDASESCVKPSHGDAEEVGDYDGEQIEGKRAIQACRRAAEFRVSSDA